jgi:ligand-binding sensor domain-containing protein
MSVRKIFLWGVLPLIVGLVAACAISEPAFQKARQRGWTTYTADNSGLVNDSVHAIAFDEQGRAWIGTYSGVNAFNGEFWANYGPNYVCAIAFDEQGRVWTGAESTVSVFDGETWTNYTADDPGLTGGSIGAIALDDQGRVWIGVNYYRPYEYYHHSVKAFDGEIWITYSADDSGLADGFINIIAFDKQGCAWVGTEHGVSVFDWETWTTYAVGDVKAIAFDEQGRAWIGTEHGISVFDGGAWTAYTADNSGLVDSAVRAIAFDERGRAWVGTERGVSVLDRGSWIIYTAENSGLKDVWDVHAIVFDKEGRAWIGSTLGGISVLSPDEVTPVPQPLVELEKYWICLLCFSPIVFAVLITIWLIAQSGGGTSACWLGILAVVDTGRHCEVYRELSRDS